MKTLTYETAIAHYMDTKDEIASIAQRAKTEQTPLKEKLAALETWITREAEKDGLSNIKTKRGTGYWSETARASVSDSAVFFDYVKESERWELMEKRVSKSAVTAQLEDTGELPPGITYGQIRNFVVRAST